MEYTPEHTKYLEREYSQEPNRATVDRIAEELQVSPRSVIGKLVSIGIYKTPRKLNKQGLPVELKRELTKEICELLGIEAPSLEKAEREQLRNLRDALKNPLNLRAILVDLEFDAAAGESF